MAKINVYLTFNGDCEAAFNFYKSVLGGDFAYIGRYKDMPPNADHPVKPEEGERIMHISLPMSKETVLMGCDTGGEWVSNYKAGNNFSLSITADSKESAEKLFSGLSTGGKVTMPLGDTFWGDYFGMFTDKFGINWMMSFNKEHQEK